MTSKDIILIKLPFKSTNRKFGKTLCVLYADQKGVYNMRVKLSFLLAICGDGDGDRDNPMWWHEDWMGEGTTVEICVAFVTRIVDDLAERYPGRCFCFKMDNLKVHKNPVTMNIILNGGHQLAFQVMHYAVDGAIEYVFNTIYMRLSLYYNRINPIDE